MTKKEFSKLSVGMKAAYPRFVFLETDEEMEFWYRLLKDIDYDIAENAVMEHINTSTFPPSIADIRRLCVERRQKEVLSFDEAWGTVIRAMSAHGWNHPQEAYAMMDELTLSVVKNLGWTRLCQSENPISDRANFREAYEEKAKALQNKAQLPEFVAKTKEYLQGQHISAVEGKTVHQIEENKPVYDVRNDYTEEQLEERSRRFADEARRRVLGG